eukprot:CAMPEP_0194299386 /NCGR_PEP_ID=MMETSP0169-20130528/60692_1 /TAXON_ID=218684 /ORGANISM="Corethron pennatum, Strain L29A3" /LENGTH=404 /DNA_ID=CAMNT_0039049479 /DNA_START=38 /DNA_END=1253 /DNA_ORIENTATION=-
MDFVDILDCNEDLNYLSIQYEVMEGHIFKPTKEWAFPDDEELLIWINIGKSLRQENKHLNEEIEVSNTGNSNVRTNSTEENKAASENKQQEATSKQDNIRTTSKELGKSSTSKEHAEYENPKTLSLYAARSPRPTPDPYKDFPYTLENTLSSVLGMYIFTEYVEEVCNDPWVISFVAEVARFREICTFSKYYAKLKAESIVSTFLSILPTTGDPNVEDTSFDSFSYSRSSMAHASHGMRRSLLSRMSPQQLFEHSLENEGKETTFKPPDPLYGKYIPRSKSMMKFSPANLQQLVEEFTVKVYSTNIFSETDDDIIETHIDRGSNHGPSTCSKLPFLLGNSSLVADVRKSVNLLFRSDRLQTDVCTLDETEAIVLEVQGKDIGLDLQDTIYSKNFADFYICNKKV